MDFGILFIPSNNPSLGRPAKMTNTEFAAAMHERYKRQWSIMAATKLAKLASLKIHGIWDDHDFAWNNGFGDSGSNDTHVPSNKRDPVSRDKQKIARRLMRDFFQAVRVFTQPYPGNPVTSDQIALDEELALPMYCADPPGPASVDLAPQVRLLLTDGRSFRTKTNSDQATVFGAKQWEWMDSCFNSEDVIVLACSTTLDQGGIPLSSYGDFDRLTALAEKKNTKLLCLTGDVHKIDWRRHGPRIFEAVASGAARSTFGLYGAFGVLEIVETQLAVKLHLDSQTPTIRRTLDRGSWREI